MHIYLNFISLPIVMLKNILTNGFEERNGFLGLQATIMAKSRKHKLEKATHFHPYSRAGSNELEHSSPQLSFPFYSSQGLAREMVPSTFRVDLPTKYSI